MNTDVTVEKVSPRGVKLAGAPEGNEYLTWEGLRAAAAQQDEELAARYSDLLRQAETMADRTHKAEKLLPPPEEDPERTLDLTEAP